MLMHMLSTLCTKGSLPHGSCFCRCISNAPPAPCEGPGALIPRCVFGSELVCVGTQYQYAPSHWLCHNVA